MLGRKIVFVIMESVFMVIYVNVKEILNYVVLMKRWIIREVSFLFVEVFFFVKIGWNILYVYSCIICFCKSILNWSIILVLFNLLLFVWNWNVVNNINEFGRIFFVE